MNSDSDLLYFSYGFRVKQILISSQAIIITLTIVPHTLKQERGFYVGQFMHCVKHYSSTWKLHHAINSQQDLIKPTSCLIATAFL